MHKNVGVLIAGAVAGIVSRTLTAPFEKVKLIAQVGADDDDRRGWRRGVFAAIAQIVKEEGGVGALFEGNGVACAKVFPASGIKHLAQAVIKARVVRATGQRPLGTWQRLLIGAAAGTIATVLTHPLEVIRTRVALASHSLSSSSSRSPLPRSSQRGVIWAVKEIASTSSSSRGVFGLGGFFGGVVPAVVGVAPFQAVNFATYELLREAAHSSRAVQVLLCRSRMCRALLPSVLGAASGAVAMCTLYPLDVIKRRLIMASPTSSNTKRSMIHTAQEIVQRDGLCGLYRGMWPALFKVVPTVSLNWLTFELTKKLLLGNEISTDQR
jgi:solute carrier family 25 phosphate transporter 23/24/25/41